MRPYLAILKDAFREAMSSRTLPFLLVFFTLVLLVLAPIGLREEVPWELRPTDVADMRLLSIKLRADQAKSSPTKRVLDRLPDDLRSRATDLDVMAKEKPPEDNPFGPSRLQRDFAEAVNETVLSDRDFFTEDVWDERSLPEEARQLAQRTNLSEAEFKRLNRLAFDVAFAGAVRPVPGSSAELTWFGGDIPLLTETLRQASVDKSEVQRQAQDLLRAISSWIVGPIGLLIAIFVTSPIIPRMFEPGEIDLLLSKPNSRTGLFLARFFCGCAFIFIVFSFFIIGLWLIVGVRLGVWNNGLLLSIPLLMFAFAVIYTISAASGVIWRNPIVSVLLAVLVWGAGFFVGLARDGIRTFRNGDKAREIVLTDEDTFVSDKNGHIYRWSDSAGDWKEILKASGNSRPMIAGLFYPLIGPVYDPTSHRLVAADIGPGGTNRLIVGGEASGWERTEGAALPPATRGLFFTADGTLLAVSQTGLYRFEGDFGTTTVGWQFWGMNITSETKSNGFVRADTSKNQFWSNDVAAAVDRLSGDVLILDRSVLSRFKAKEGVYEVAESRELDSKKPAVLGFGGGRAVAAFADGNVRLFDAVTLKDVATRKIPEADPPRVVEVSPDGKHAAVLTHGGNVFLYDATQGESLPTRLRGNGDVSAVAFGKEGSFWTADRLTRLTQYDARSLERQKTLEGSISRVEFIYRYALGPLTWILPNTYGLRNAETYLFTERKSEAFGGPDARLEAERLTYDVWGPIWQNLTFLTVVLGLTCVYIARKDF